MIATESNINELRGKAGVYRFITPSGYVYIGSSHNLHGRLKEHARRCHSVVLRRSIEKYGLTAHEVTILEFVDISGMTKYAARKVILSAEQRWIDDGFATYGDRMLNICPTAGSSLGVKRTDEQREKTGAASRKRFEDPAAREKIAAAHRKRYEDPAAREKTGAAMRKRYEDPVARENTSTAMRKRYEDPAARANTSAAIRKHYEDPAARAKSSAARRKHYEDPAARERNSAAVAAVTGGNVTVEGHGDFSSVHYAFEKLGIYARGNPKRHHQTFRAALKKAGTLTYTERNGQAWHFSIVQRA